MNRPVELCDKHVMDDRNDPESYCVNCGLPRWVIDYIDWLISETHICTKKKK